MSINMSYFTLYSDEEYSPGLCNSGFQNDLVLAEFQVVPQEVYNELNTGWSDLPHRLNEFDVSPFLEDDHHRSLSQNITPSTDDHNHNHGFEWDAFDFPKSGYFPSTCGTLNFQLDHLNTKLDFLEEEIQKLNTSAVFDLCWEQIDDLCWEEVECIIPQGKCFRVQSYWYNELSTEAILITATCHRGTQVAFNMPTFAVGL
uniref:uncharacterized protein n=1 Tax=Myxine glutinosa TaxID=7769 RepID=UPI00358FC6D4